MKTSPLGTSLRSTAPRLCCAMPTVTAAVLETARGGLIKRGMYLDRCDVAVLLNVEREQIGMDGIETLDDMTALKRKVLDAARKAVVLNADDPRCLALAPEFASSVRIFLFSRNAVSQAFAIIAIVVAMRCISIAAAAKR